jgi:DNA integrity scanning protein DisA with diadenylate cyclase activity
MDFQPPHRYMGDCFYNTIPARNKKAFACNRKNKASPGISSINSAETINEVIDAFKILQENKQGALIVISKETG